MISARFSPDEATAYLGVFNGVDQDIFLATRGSRSEPFGTPTPLTTLNTSVLEDFASATADGRAIYFESYRNNYSSLFVSTRTFSGASFSTPVELTQFHVNAEGGPYVTPDGRALYFHTFLNNNFDIYRASAFGVVESLSVNTTDDEEDPVISADELTIYFRVGSSGVWMATRMWNHEAFNPAVSLADLSIPGWVAAPTWISPDGCRLYMQEYNPATKEIWIYVAER